MADLEKEKKTKDLNENDSTEIRDFQYTEKPQEVKEEEPEDDLEFISEETVKDKSKMAEGKPISDEHVSKKKTIRRGVDELEAKKEKSLAFFKKNLPLIAIGCLVIIVGICALVIITKKQKTKRAEENKAQPVSAQEYEKDEYEEINALIENYYKAYASGDTDTILQYANPMTDMEKSYISMYSQYIENYENINCYTKTGAEDTSYIVSVAFELKYKGVDTPAPGLDFFYVGTADNGSVYIDNVYSTFNLIHAENPLDDNVRQLIEAYRTGEDVVALQASVQTKYETAVQEDENLRKMIDETLTNAISAWTAEQEAAKQQKEQEAQQKIAEQETQQPQEEPPAEDPNAQQNTGDTAETEQKAWVYATETVNIRQEANEQSAVLASAVKGSELRQLAVTANGWSKVKTGEIVGYIKSEYISGQKPESSSSATYFDEGKRIYLTATVNVRESMSESAGRVGVAYAGETVTVVMSYDEGWTKVNWNGQTGYVKTDVLAGM